MSFPSTLSTFNRPATTDRLNNPSHSALHNTVSSALGQVEAVIGVDGASSVVGTMMYDLRSPASGGGGHVQVANKGGTGQTNFAKGDILVAQSSSVLSKLAVGADNLALVADSTQAIGLKWGGVTTPISSVFTISSVWTKPAGVTYVKVICIGGGGGGARSANGGTTVSGGGGAGGGKTEEIFFASILGATETVTVGTGGAGATAESTNGGLGNDSSFGTWLIAKGGGRGIDSLASEAGGNGMGPGSAGGVVNTTGTVAGLGGAGGSGGRNSGGVGSTGAVGSRFGAGAGGTGGAGVANAGGAGGAQTYRGSVLNGGTAGAAGGGAGGAGTAVPTNDTSTGTGGGGGGGQTGTGGAGGAGGKYGGGGGGGGSGSTTSGNGGNGADGIVFVMSW